MTENRQMEWLLEQIEAAKDVVHLYKCFYCQIATAQMPVVIVRDNPQGARVTVVGVCNTCATTDGDEAEIGV